MTDFRLPLLALALLGSLAYASPYQYIRLGNKEDVQTKTTMGIAMLGGGNDLDEAFRWLCENAVLSESGLEISGYNWT